nr:immunoglobulin heavy chain junction region [Mus musculus]
KNEDTATYFCARSPCY